MSYPYFKFLVSARTEDWTLIAQLVKEDWRLTKTSDGYYISVLKENPKVFFATDSIGRLLVALERYMGHKWMKEHGLMEKIK